MLCSSGHLLLVQLVLLWTTTVHAFFPWYPAAVCAKDAGLCKDHTVTPPGTVQEERDAPPPVSFKVGRRIPAAAPALNGEPLRARVERTALRLSRKYAATAAPPKERRGQPVRNRAVALADTALTAAGPRQRPDRTKRTNSFSIDRAVTPTATHAVGVDQDGTDFSYFVQTDFGSAGTPMNMLLDTGAGTTWVMGSSCTSAACNIHSTFGPTDSTSLKTSSETFSIAYGSGTVAGNLVTDAVSLAGMKATMSFGLANTTSDDFTHFPFDGILGLSLSKGATDNFLQTIQSAKLLAANLFAVSLSRASDGPTNYGEVTFGATDPTKFTGSIKYTGVPASADHDWAIPMDNLGYGSGSSASMAGITGRLAYIDTGTTYVFGPAADVAALHKLIPGASSTDGVTYTAPCSTDSPLTVVFSGVSYTISAKDWLEAPVSDDATRCTSNVYGREVVTGAWLLGDVFLKNVYAVFDVDKSQIGFASKAAVSEPSASTSASSSGSSESGHSGSSSGSSGSGGSNGSSSGSTVSAPVTLATGSSSTSGGSNAGLPGLSGHETSATAVAESTSAPKPPQTSASPAEQLESSGRYVTMVCIVAAIAIAV